MHHENAVYLADSDMLMVSVTAAVAVMPVLTLRIQRADGSVALSVYSPQTIADRTRYSFVYPLSAGLLLSAVLTCPLGGQVRRGALYAVASVFRGTQIGSSQYSQLLFAGYVSSVTPLFFPWGESGDAFEGRGNLRSLVGTQPSNGNGILETVPAGAFWRLSSFRYTLHTSAAAGNRAPMLYIDDGVNFVCIIEASIATTPGSSMQYVYMQGFTPLTPSTSVATNMLPPELLLCPGYRIWTYITNEDASDWFSAPNYQVEEWLQL